MSGKAERTRTFILETVAPIFNKKGYAATSLSDITEATGLTKGAVYGNFRDKEELALAAFNHNVHKLLSKISNRLKTTSSAIQQLFILTNFYRFYGDYTKELGGCPVLNVGVDAHMQNARLTEKVQQVIEILQDQIEEIIKDGKVKGEIWPYLKADVFARQIFIMIQGAVFFTVTMNDPVYLKETMDTIDKMIINQLKT
ncbi:TetR/AcrR family transcriptional regulator [Ascidiimonas aurantiaca]|uniref:TetR/AcrR family transcriptional regulator n=1 Tax=Ascidiimonas aurantiaca TaxID=1685432 RepID=UPI0030EB9798